MNVSAPFGRVLCQLVFLVAALWPGRLGAAERWMGAGDNEYGQLGDGTLLNRPVPVVVAQDAATLAGGWTNTLFIKADGTLWGTGSNRSQQLGAGVSGDNQTTPVLIASDVRQADAGGNHVLFIKTDGSLWALGDNTSGQLGDGSTTQRGVPVRVADGVSQVAAGYAHSLFIKTDGTLWGMGANKRGELGDGGYADRSTPVQIAAAVAQVAAGEAHSLFVKTDGTLWGMGANYYGCLGDGTSTVRTLPVPVATGVKEVATTGLHTLFVKTDGTLWAAGWNYFGELGDGTTVDRSLPVQIASQVEKIAGGSAHSLFLKTDGTVWATGFNHWGEFGNGTYLGKNSPVKIAVWVSALASGGPTSFWRQTPLPSITTAQPLVFPGGQSVTLGLDASGDGTWTYQWYRGARGDVSQPVAGAVGPAFTTPPVFDETSYWVRILKGTQPDDTPEVKLTGYVPPAVAGQPAALVTKAGDNAELTVAATGGALAYQWYEGAAGDVSRPVPGATGARLVSPPLDASTSYWVRITNPAGGTDSAAAAVTVTPFEMLELRGTGANGSGQLADGTTQGHQRPMFSLSGVARMATGYAHTLVLKTDGTLWAAGANDSGQLGDGTKTTRTVPVLVASGIADVSTGDYATLYLKKDGTLWLVGTTLDGAYAETVHLTPVQLAGGVARIAMGGYHGLFQKTDGSLWGFGLNGNGQLGDAAPAYNAAPVKLVAAVKGIAAGNSHSFYITTDGTLWATGYGPLGVGNIGSVLHPMAVAVGVEAVFTGSSSAGHTLFLKTDGTLWGMGQNDSGQLGVSGGGSQSFPVQVSDGVARAAVGSRHSLFAKTDGTVWAMGYNLGGQLGDGTTITRLSPVQVAEQGRALAAGDMHSLLLQPASPEIVAGPPASVTATDGAVAFAVSATSPLPMTYQWYRGLPGDVSTSVPGGTAASLSLTGLTGGERFWVRVANTTGFRDSGGTLVLMQPAISVQPARPAAALGSNVAFSVAAIGGELSYQWYRGAPGDTSQPIGGAGGTTLVLPADQAGGPFWVRAANAVGAADSAAVTMTATPPIPRHLTRAGSQNLTGSTGNSTVAVPVAQDVIRMSAGKSSPITQHFIKADGTLWGLGYNSLGQVGDGSTAARTVPVQIATGVGSVSSGGAHTLFVKLDGGLWGTGYNSDGQLGDGTATSRYLPVPIATGVAQASAGVYHSLFVKTDGTLWAMGNNAQGQLGDGTLVARSVPVKVAEDVAYAVAGGYYSGGVSLFIKRDGSLWGMGANALGQLGGSGGGNRSTPVQIATGVTGAEVGSQHTLILKADGTLWGLGYDFYGQLGDGTGTNATAPVQIATSVLQAAAGGDYSLFLKTDHSLWAMGDNSYGQFGNGTTTGYNVATQVAALAWDISAGPSQSLRLVNPPPVILGQPQSATIVAGATATLSVSATDSESLSYQWYLNSDSITTTLVPGATSAAFTPPAQTAAGTASYWVRVSNASNLVDSQVVTVTTCTLPAVALTSGSVTVNYGAATTLSAVAVGGLLSYQWYAGESGDTGVPVAGATGTSYAVPAAATTDTLRFWLRVTNIAGHTDSPTAVVSVRPAILDQPDPASVPLGQSVTLSVAAGGSSPLSFQWYRGSRGDVSQPVAGAVGTTFTLLAPTDAASYWVRVTNAAGTVDSVAVGVVAVVAPSFTAQPAPVGGTVGFGGPGIARVVVAGGGLSYQWYLGQPGDTSAPVAGATGPLLLTPPLRADTVFWVRAWNSLGTVDSAPVTLAVAPAAPLALFATGANSYGQLGLGTTTSRSLPGRTALDVVQVSAGTYFSLFVKADGTLWGMGYGSQGQLGGSDFTTLSPVKIATDVATVAAGADHALFLKYDGSLWSMGSNSYGQRGVSGSSTAPTLVTTGVARIAAGAAYSLFLKTDGSLWGMGLNIDGQLGLPGTYTSSTPLQITTNVVQVAAGNSHSLFLGPDGTAWGMGHNGYGQLGDGTNTFRQTPVMLATGVAGLAAGAYHSLFIKTDNTLWASGYNGSGALGDGTTVYRNVPVQVATNVAMAAGDHVQGAGSGFTLFVKRDGTLWATGANSYGQLGDGTTTGRLTPVQIASSVTLVAAGGSHALFTQTPPPRITAQPTEVGVVAGGSVSLHVEAWSESPIAYQWYTGVPGDIAQPVSGATTATYVTPSITGNKAYWVRLTNAFGATDSAAILVTVCTTPSITVPPSPATLIAGRRAVLTVTATGGVLGYQWYRGATGDTSTPLAGATGPILTTAPLGESGYYWVRISNVAGATDGAATFLTVFPSADLLAAGDNSQAELALGFSGSITPAASVASQVAKVAAGASHTLFLKTDGTLWAVGRNLAGQLGDGTTTDRVNPVQVATGVVEIAAGGSHSLFVKNDGTAWAMGSNSSYQLGDGTNVTRSTPVQIATQVAKVAAGSLHTLLLKTDGTLLACGSKTSGQLGNGIVSGGTSTLVQVATQVAGIAAGASHSLALKTDGSLWATGLNSSGQLGDGSTTNRGAFSPIFMGVTQVAAGGACTWFVGPGGSLWTAGQGTSGQLADGGGANRSVPTQVASGVSQIAIGGSHGLFIKTDASLWAVGSNTLGQLGDGTRVPRRSTPVKIADGVARIAAGSLHSLFVTGDGTLWTAGGNTYGQLANGERSDRPSPGLAQTGVIAVAAGTVHTMFITADHTLWGVGGNDMGQLGDGSTDSRIAPVEIAEAVESVVAGPISTFFIKTDGTLWGMGTDSTGHLGLGATAGLFAQPARIADNVLQVSTGGEHTLFVKRDGTLWAMGGNQAGQFGLGTFTSGSNVPVQIASQVLQAVAGPTPLLPGYGFSAFLKTDGTLWAMGSNAYGQLGTGTIGSTISGLSTPRLVASDVTQISAGARALLFLQRNILWGIGSSASGELGQAGSFQTPVKVATQVARVTASGHTLFLKQDGSLWATGPNSFGQLGDGTKTTRFTPVQIATGVLDMAAGTAHSLFLRIPSPVLLTAPSPVVARVGTRVEFSVGVTPLPGVPLSFQWRRDGTPLTSSTASSNHLVIDSAQLSDAGAYDVVVTHGGVSSTSSPASLTVHTEDQTTYAAWASANAVSGGASDDPEGGGTPNLLRFAFKLPAHGPSPSPLSLQTANDTDGPHLTVAFTRKSYAPGLSYLVEASSDLVTWTTVTTLAPGLPEAVVAQDSVPLSSQPRRYLRVRVDLAP